MVEKPKLTVEVSLRDGYEHGLDLFLEELPWFGCMDANGGYEATVTHPDGTEYDVLEGVFDND